MTISHVAPAAICLLLLASTSPAMAETSPVFGRATVDPISNMAARDIMARGYWADFYGSAAVNHSYNAYIFSFYARYYASSNSATEQSWYATASINAYYAYVYSYYAGYYSSLGM